MIRFPATSTLRSAGWFLAPFAAVGLIVVTSDSPEPSARPTSVSDEAPSLGGTDPFPKATKRSPLDEPESLTLVTEIERLSTLAPFATPFASQEQYQHEPEPTGNHPVQNNETHEFQLTSVMSGAGGNVCVINKKVRRAGDTIAGGWKINEIDTSNRRVILQNAAGEELVLSHH